MDFRTRLMRFYKEKCPSKCNDVDIMVVKYKNNEKQLFRQLTRITRDKGALRHDDQIDALAIAANYWVERMDRDQILAFDQHKEELLDRELELFMETAIGATPKGDNWL